MITIDKETKLTLLYILLAFTFSVAMRFIWVYQFWGVEAFMFNGQFMINTNDGYYYAEGARDILSGISQNNDYSPITSAGSLLTAFFAKILPFSFESIIFYLPVFLSSLVVIPIILIAKVLKNLEMGFIAALFASITWSYYNRTMVGYFDTDMLNIVLPMFLLWSIIWAIKTKQNIYLLLSALDIIVYRWWYPQSYSLEFSFFGLVLLYTLVFDRKNIFNYKLLAIMIFAMMGLDGYSRLALVLVVYYTFTQEKLDRYIYYVLSASIITFFVTGGFEPILNRLQLYIFDNSVSTSESGIGLHFFTVMQTIREAGHIPFDMFANRISGHSVTFILSVLGYIYLVYKERVMIFALPMIGLGFLASVGGLRFTIYAVPILALGIAFLITEVSNKMPTTKIKHLSMIAFTLAILYPNYKHIDSYKVPTVFNSSEVKVLDALKSEVDREDYVIGWWDYGFPIRYYTDVKTLADGAQHSGDRNFPISFMLTHPQNLAAKMARLDVEYTEKKFESNRSTSNVEQMTLDYGFKNTNDFLLSLETDIKLPSKTRNVYLYLPNRMLNIYPTVSLFSNMDLMTGAKGAKPFFYISKSFSQQNNMINLGNNIVVDMNKGTVNIGNKTMPIHRFAKTAYDEKMKLQKSIQVGNTSSNINIIFMSNYNTFLVIDDNVYESLYIQLMVLENYDKNLFEEVSFNPHVKVYKLKI